MERLAKLFALQQHLTTKKKLERELKRLEEGSTLEEQKQRVEQLTLDYEQKRETSNQYTRDIKKLEDQSETVQRQRKDYERRMYTGEITNSKELEQMQKKVVQLQKEEVRLEEQMLDMMLALDEVEEQESSLQEILEKERGRYQENRQAFEEQKQAFLEGIQEAREKIETMTSLVDKDVYETFSAIAQKAGGLGIVAVKGNLCGGCQVMVSARQLERVTGAEEMVICESCGRILYGGKR